MNRGDDEDSVVDNDDTVVASISDGTRLTDDDRGANGWALQFERRNIQPKQHAPPLSLLRSCWRWVKNAWLIRELFDQFKLAIPIILTLILQQSLPLISLTFVGHASSNNSSIPVDATGLGIAFANINGISVGVGLTSAADTLCAQAYGYKNYKRVGIIIQRGLLILLTISLFIWCVWLNTESVMLLLQQPPCVARYSSDFVRIYSLVLPFWFLYLMLQKYLQTQSIVWPFILVGVISNILCVVLHAILLMAVHLGVIGAAISLVLSNASVPLMLILYIRIRNLHRLTWGGWSWESLRGWGQFLKLGIPGMIMICMEWISFEISTFVVGSLGEVPLAANAIIINLLTVIFMVPLGISIVVSVRVGNELGAGNPKKARRAAYVACGIIIVNAAIVIIILEMIRDKIAVFYGAQDEVNDILKTLMHIVCALLLFDQLQGVISGIIRGAGRQLHGAVINSIAYYVVGLPLGISLALATNLGILGMWIGLMCASFTQATLYLVLICRLNWEKESEKAIKIARTETENSEMIAGDDEGGTEVSLDAINDGIKLQAYKPVSQDLEEVDLNEAGTEDNHSISEDNMMSEDGDIDLLVPSEPVVEFSTRWKIKSLLSRGSIVMIGIVLLIASGIASQYHPPDSVINGNYSECDENTTDDSY